ncbi:biotin sulfoxide reductase [Klebsiella variicola]|nr:biotin sulfoxide reductase [Klebsiella variicola]
MSRLAVCPLRNAQVNGGGANDHMLPYWLDKMQANGTRFINISPVRNDLSAVPTPSGLAIRPGTDTALLLALSYVLIAESLYDQAFVASHTVGFAPYRAYLLGEHDGGSENPGVGGGDYRPGCPAHRRPGAGDGPPPDRW